MKYLNIACCCDKQGGGVTKLLLSLYCTDFYSQFLTQIQFVVEVLYSLLFMISMYLYGRRMYVKPN